MLTSGWNKREATHIEPVKVSVAGVFLLEVVWWLKKNYEYEQISAFPWLEEPVSYSCVHAFTSGITQQKAVNMQSRLITFPRSLVQKCVHKSPVCCAVMCLQTSEYLQTRCRTGFIGICSGVNEALREASFGQKVFLVNPPPWKKNVGLELLEHLSSGGFNRRVCTRHLKVHSSFESSPKAPAKPTNSACRLKTSLISSNPWQPLCVCVIKTGLNWYLCIGVPISWLNF